MPLFDPKELLECTKHLVHLDQEWFPKEDDSQLHVRYAHFSTEAVLGVKPPSNARIVAMLSPTSIKQKGLAVKAIKDVNKNWPLGHGQYTISGNYGPLVPTISEARQNGFDDIMWLQDNNIQDLTFFNLFFVMTNRYGIKKIYTPPDNGCILNGVQR